MNDERDITDIERLVSETYREAATEQAPERLSEKILRMAAGAAAHPQQRSAYAFAAAWLRPAAWAATIGLSLAIVLNVMQEPVVQPVQLDVTRAAAAEGAVAGRLEEAQSRVDFEAESARVDDLPAPAAEPRGRPFIASEGLASASASDKFKPRSRDIPRKAGNQALRLPGPNVRQEKIAIAAAVEKKESGATGSCDKESRETAASWFACITVLRESGFTDDADSEHDEFILKFPAFEPKK